MNEQIRNPARAVVLSTMALVGAVSAAAAQEVTSYDPNPARVGGVVRIEGTALRPAGAHELRYGSDAGGTSGGSILEVLGWTETEIQVRLPSGLEPGRYWVALYDRGGRLLTNRLHTLDVEPALTTSGAVMRAPVRESGRVPRPVGGVRARLPEAVAPPRTTFRCGPHLLTYAVRSLDERPHRGVRCVLPDPEDPQRFAWYAEGVVDSDLRYRHVGLRSASGAERHDIFGNGETFANTGRPTLVLSEFVLTPLGRAPRRVMDRSGGGEWVLEEDGVVAGFAGELGPVKECGRHLREYSVTDHVDLFSGERPREGSGIRCALYGKRAWYGEGEWGGTRYVHLGLKDDESEHALAADICDGSRSRVCGHVSQGRIELGFVCLPGRGPVETVTGAWRERWLPHFRGLADAAPIEDFRCLR